MATGLNVNGKIVIRPGVYSIILSGIQNPPANLPYGNVLIIDDGIGAGWGGGSGVDGQLKSGKNAIYNFTDIGTFRNFVKGGELWNLAQPLFKPILNNQNIPGISKLTYIRACETTPATITYSLTYGSFTIKTKDEGLNANGVLTGGILTQGYGATLINSPVTAGKYRLQIWHGTFVGIDPLNNASYNNIAALNTTAGLVCTSPDVSTIGELVTWMQNDKTFNQGFVLSTDTIPSTTTTSTTTLTTTTTTTGQTTTTSTTLPIGAILPADVTNNLGYKLATGGTENYTSQAFTDALNAIKDADNTFFLGMQYGDGTENDDNGVTGTNNTAIFNFITSGDSRFEKFLVVAAGYDQPDYTTTTIDAVEYYNSDSVIVVHGGGLKTSRAVSGFTAYSQLYKAANMLGRLAGLEPQVPLTFKSLDFDGEVHILSDDEIDYALENGILVSYQDTDLNADVVLQDINTLQNNEYLINEDNTSFSIQIKRIEAQLNRDIIINAKKTFFGNATQGANRNTVSPTDIVTWLGGYLTSITANAQKDDLILAWRNIVVTTDQDNIIVTYEFSPNSEISKLLFIGTMFTL